MCNIGQVPDTRSLNLLINNAAEVNLFFASSVESFMVCVYWDNWLIQLWTVAKLGSSGSHIWIGCWSMKIESVVDTEFLLSCWLALPVEIQEVSKINMDSLGDWHKLLSFSSFTPWQQCNHVTSVAYRNVFIITMRDVLCLNVHILWDHQVCTMSIPVARIQLLVFGFWCYYSSKC